jgi:FkbM family methyltransferase
VSSITGLLKPCYVFAPRTLVRRLGMSLLPFQCPAQVVHLPWGTSLEVNASEGIGRELLHQNVFDIAVTETAWRLLKADDIAVDVGANIGYITSLFAARVGPRGRVESFEPHPRIFARLRQNVCNLKLGAKPTPIELHECALGDRDGTAQLIEPTSFSINEGASTLVATEDGASPESPSGFEIRLARLDSVLGDCDIALLKVDVEGFEARVLAGAERLLARRRITNIIYEAHECERSPVHAILSHYGYSVFGIGHDLLGLRITPGTAAPRVDRRWESPSYLATLIPDAALALVRARGWQVLRGC